MTYALKIGAGDVAAVQTSSAISRNLNFCTLPVEVFGKSAKTT